jgi:hypothetical protein
MSSSVFEKNTICAKYAKVGHTQKKAVAWNQFHKTGHYDLEKCHCFKLEVTHSNMKHYCATAVTQNWAPSYLGGPGFKSQPRDQLFWMSSFVWDFKFSRQRVWCSELSSGFFCGCPQSLQANARIVPQN